MMHRTRTEFDFWGRKYGTHTSPLQEQLAPPDDCRNCLKQKVLPATTNAHDNVLAAVYICGECGYDWTQTWRLQPVSELGATLSP